MNISTSLALIFAVLIYFVNGDVCNSRNFHAARGPGKDDYIIYGLTQDCQIFFIRPSQLVLLGSMRVNIYNNYCSSNLVQLHVTGSDSLLLLMKQAGNRICTLEVQIPSMEMLFGDHLFSYSLLNSLPYASCSHFGSTSVQLETDLSFMDSVFKDVVYFVDGSSSGAVWNVHQFLLTPQGHFRQLDKLTMGNHDHFSWKDPEVASEFIIGQDVQKNLIYLRNKYKEAFWSSCSFDLLYRPERAIVNRQNVTRRHDRTAITSVAAEGSLLIYSEIDRSIQPAITKLYAMNSTSDAIPQCVSMTSFSMDFGIVRTSSLEKLREKPLPNFDINKKRATMKGTSTSTKSPVKTSTARVLKATTELYRVSSASAVTRVEFQEPVETPISDEFEDVLDDEDKDEEESEANTEGIPLATDQSTVDSLDIKSNSSHVTSSNCVFLSVVHLLCIILAFQVLL